MPCMCGRVLARRLQCICADFMRLTSIKLAGFKSFVDPTTIPLPGQLIGIVGPNGCGKSNVIDAVRWVLGESKASALRGESMEDVIFNGAGERKPVSRTSVELVFDNSAGRPIGQWSHYAELSIKRVLQRDVGSSYYINNQPVRRRDILDVFLGTGLGPRAYAVIEQGMISRIIEAKPEELRVFLEEAAGVSRYKERRRETESRLIDTRENLARVQDIQNELASQLERLEGQAKVAARWRELDRMRADAQALLYAQRREEAVRSRESALRVLAEAETALLAKEAEFAALMSEIEALRQAVFAANEQQHRAQGAFYEITAEVTRVEQQLAFERERASRVTDQLSQCAERIRTLADEAEQIDQALLEANDAVAVARAKHVDQQSAVESAQVALPAAERALREAATALSGLQQRLSETDGAIQVAQVKRGNAERLVAQLDQRSRRLEEERSRLSAPADEELTALIEQLESEQAELAAAEATAQASEEAATEADQARATRRREHEQAAERLSAVKARYDALTRLQQSLERQNDAELSGWVAEQGLRGTPLWKSLRVEAGWDDAIEAVLRERLNALPVDDAERLLRIPVPPVRLTIVAPAAGESPRMPADALISKVSSEDRRLGRLLAEWLHGYRVSPDRATAHAQLHTLAAGERFVLPEGHIVDASSITFFAPEAAIHGATTRQREIAALAQELTAAERDAQAAAQALAAAERRYQEVRVQATQQRGTIVSIQRRVHALDVERMQIEQARMQASERMRRIDAEQAEIAQARRTEVEAVDAQTAVLARLEGERGGVLSERDAARLRRNEADVLLIKARESLRAAENALRDAMYAERVAQDRVAELRRRQTHNERERNVAASEQERLAQESASILLAPIEASLQQLLAARTERETTLRCAREAVESANQQLIASEEQRLVREREFEPIRKRIEDARVRQSAAESSIVQFDEQLAHLKVAPEALAERLADAPRGSALQATVTRLENDIAALGAVNLAALDELEQARERKLYLDAQATDLAEAIATLEDAIRRIDRETRAQLSETYAKVNEHFGRLFPTLFGGGQARLTLTGDEILDAGIQVIAQPPGKRNSSIHLLSGGEKALTATALVFALFHLNPAPFCLLDEVDAPLDDPNTERFCRLVRQMATQTQFLFISHNKITMEMAEQLIGVTMNEPGVSRIVGVDVAQAIRMAEAA